MMASPDDLPAGPSNWAEMTPRRYRVLVPLSPPQGPLIPIGAVWEKYYDPDTEARMIERGILRPMADGESDDWPQPTAETEE